MWAPPSPPITGSLREFLHHQEAPEHLSWGGAAEDIALIRHHLQCSTFDMSHLTS